MTASATAFPELDLTDPTVFKILEGHKSIEGAADDHPMYVTNAGFEFRDAIGRQSNSGKSGYRWLTLTCSLSACPAKAIFRIHHLEDLISAHVAEVS